MSDNFSVLLVGGTHGNELTGVHLIQRWMKNESEIQRSGLTSSVLLANTEAIKQNRRYIDADLNRQFAQESLLDSDVDHSEAIKAKELSRFVSEGSGKDFIIDLHTTTANMDVTLVVNDHSKLALKAATYVKEHMSGVTIMHQVVNKEDDSFLISLGHMGGIIVEVGPVAQGLLNADAFEKTRLAVEHILDYLSQQLRSDIVLPASVAAFQFIEKIKLPENEQGELIGMIHSGLQGKDFLPLKTGSPMFLLQTGETIYYDGEDGFVGAFINEAAYYDQHHGFSLLKPVQLHLSD